MRSRGRGFDSHVGAQLRNDRGQVDHTRLPRRRQSSLLYGVVKPGTFTFTFTQLNGHCVHCTHCAHLLACTVGCVHVYVGKFLGFYYTDDSAMTLAIANSLIRQPAVAVDVHQFDAKDMANG